MKIFGIKFEAKKEPRYPSYEDFAGLSDVVSSLSDGMAEINRKLEAYDKRYYRAQQRDEAEKVISKPRPRFEAGMVLSSEQALEILRGDGQ